jgi:hypothetical protein
MGTDGIIITISRKSFDCLEVFFASFCKKHDNTRTSTLFDTPIQLFLGIVLFCLYIGSVSINCQQKTPTIEWLT